MGLPRSAISQVCKYVREFVNDGLKSTDNTVDILLGTPAEAVKGQVDTKHRINLFFHRFGPARFGEHLTPKDPWRLRLNCLITSFATGEDNVSAGENDLRLIGEVMRLFHETPVLSGIEIQNADDTVRDIVDVQVIFQPLTLDEINHLWSTQGDVAFRPSVLYEMALGPIYPSEPASDVMRVGAAGIEVHGTTDVSPNGFEGEVFGAPVRAVTVAVNRLDWTPHICFVNEQRCEQSVALAVSAAEPTDFKPHVWIAGRTDELVTLRWDVWDSESGFQADGVGLPFAPIGETIDPLQPPPAADLPTIALPFNNRPGQAALYALRTIRKPGDTRDRELRSNPLLITLYEEGA